MRINLKRAAAAIGSVLIAAVLLGLLFFLPGCGCDDEKISDDNSSGNPEFVTAYQAVEYTKEKATKWQKENWIIRLSDGDPDGINRQGKARIWVVYYFSPRPELKPQYQIQYNRGNIFPSAPAANRGGDDGRKIYIENEPGDFRVDSPEAYQVAIKNGGGEFLDNHTDAVVHAELRCKADYLAIDEKMPAPKYKWIWDISFKEPRANVEILHVLVDGMNGEFITTEIQKPLGE
ncbi:MAG: hypothetical protein JXA49_05030 [Actinobacteria bacterium]|nr:hypothetical protein [Actinomycetota bacterium]